MRSLLWTGLAVSVLTLSLTTTTHSQGAQTQPPPGRSVGTDTMGNHPITADEKGGIAETGPYEVIPDFFKPPFPPGWTWGPVAGILAESPNRIYVYQRGILPAQERNADGFGLPLRNATSSNDPNSELGKSLRREYILTVYDGNGNLIEHWKHLDALHGPGAPGALRGSLAHRLRMNPWDPDKHLWLVDEGFDHVFKITRNGNIVMTVTACRRAQDIAFLPTGDFWCLEGIASGARVRKFSKDGKELMNFGMTGDGPGELGGHSITVDRQGRIYIGEPGNRRIQVFDQSGKLLDSWPNIRSAAHLSIDVNDRLWVSEFTANKILAFDLKGRLIYSGWGVTGTAPGRMYGPSQFWVDSAGNLYLAEIFGGRAQKFRPKKGANPKELMGMLIQ